MKRIDRQHPLLSSGTSTVPKRFDPRVKDLSMTRKGIPPFSFIHMCVCVCIPFPQSTFDTFHHAFNSALLPLRDPRSSPNTQLAVHCTDDVDDFYSLILTFVCLARTAWDATSPLLTKRCTAGLSPLLTFLRWVHHRHDILSYDTPQTRPPCRFVRDRFLESCFAESGRRRD